MGVEIERKFLLANDTWRAVIDHSSFLEQGYLNVEKRCSVRVRIDTEDAFLNIKTATLGIERREFEYPIPRTDAAALLQEFCGDNTLRKVRHHVYYHDHHWEIDEFEGANSGLVVAEIELTHADEHFERPPWLGAEVSHLRRYYNVCLIAYPYVAWSESERIP